MVIRELIKELTSITFRHEAYILLSHVLNCSIDYLKIHDDNDIYEQDIKKVMDYAKRRKSGEPLQYITNEAYFYGNKFYVDENVLIPRADTEILVQKVIEYASRLDNAIILDMCTGTGCIAITIKKELNSADIYAVDISERALSVANKNAEANNVNVKFILSNLFENLEQKELDIIISNPPYIEKEEINNLSDEVKKEPKLALDGGIDGLDFYRKIASDGRKYLKNGGRVFFEIGYNQAPSVEQILLDNGYTDIQVYKDYGGNDRVASARWIPPTL